MKFLPLLLLSTLCTNALFAVTAEEFTLVDAGETLELIPFTVTNATQHIRAKANATILVRSFENLPGFAQYNIPIPQGAQWDSFWTNSLPIYAPSIVQESTKIRLPEYQTTLYSADWFIPADGTYSFYEDIDDHISIEIDGQVVLKNSSWNTPTTVRNIVLSNGWHELTIRHYNASWTGGANDNQPALLYSPTNADIQKGDLKDGVFFHDPGDGSILRSRILPGSISECRLPQGLLIDGGEVTLDLSQVTEDEFRFGSFLICTNGGSLKVVGRDKVLFGTPKNEINYPLFDASLSFTNEQAEGLLFVDQSTIRKWPSPCPYSIDPDAHLALWSKDILTGTNITFDAYDATILAMDAINPETPISVGTNRTLHIKPCNVNEINFWEWSGTSGTFSNNVELLGKGATLKFINRYPVTFTGSLSGTGSLVADTGEENSKVLFDQPSEFIGNIAIPCGNLRLRGDTPGGSTSNPVHIGERGGLTFLAVDGTSGTHIVRIDNLTSDSSNGSTIWVRNDQEYHIGTFSGLLAVSGESSYQKSVLSIDNICTNSDYRTCEIQLCQTVDLHLGKTDGCFTMYRVAHASKSHIQLNQTDIASFRMLGTGKVIASGMGSFRIVNGSGMLYTEKGSDISFGIVGPEITVLAENSNVRMASTDYATLEKSWGASPILWLDASATDSLHPFLNRTYTNGYPVIDTWYDCRPGRKDLRMYNDRLFFGGPNATNQNINPQCYPFLVTNGLNGCGYLSMGSRQGTISGLYGPTGNAADTATEARRLNLWNGNTKTNIAIRTMLMVFGSQNGGGDALIAGSGSLNRPWNDTTKKAEMIFNESHHTWVDCTTIDPKVTNLSGDWQIIGAYFSPQNVNAIGWKSDYANSGGQNYAEIMLFEEELSHPQIILLERYLAIKWGIKKAGGIEGKTMNQATVNGTGTLTVERPTELDGSFQGTIALAASGSVNLSAAQPAPDDSAVVSEGRVGWFDPDADGVLTYAPASETESPTNSIYGLVDRVSRTNGTPYLAGTYAPHWESPYDRRPSIVRSARGNGPERNWIDFANISDAKGNTLRFKPMPVVYNGEVTGVIPVNVRTIMMATDTSRGGGVPFADTIAMNGLIKPRSISNPYAPIWSSSNASYVRNSKTWLDGTVVNGTSYGFHGIPEIFTCSMSTNFPALCFGYYGQDKYENYEIIGEILLYNRELTDDERADMQAYLMQKWVGRLPSGYADLSKASLSGTGSIITKNAEQLPAFTSDYTGKVDFTGTTLAFVFDKTVAGSIRNPLNLGAGTFQTPESGLISVSFATEPVAGIYPLLTAGNIAAPGLQLGTEGKWTTELPEIGGYLISLEEQENQLLLRVSQAGMVIFLR